MVPTEYKLVSLPADTRDFVVQVPTGNSAALHLPKKNSISPACATRDLASLHWNLSCQVHVLVRLAVKYCGERGLDASNEIINC